MLARRTIFAATAALAALPARAQENFPSRAVRVIVPFPPGGATDVIARLVCERLSARWGQPVVIENRGGAGTMIGTQMVARAVPDGYTFGFVISAHAINPAIRSDVPYDTVRDFSPIGQVARAHVVLVASSDLAARDLRSVVALSKQGSAGLSVATPGIGTVMHMVMEMLAAESGAQLVHVPYAGGAPAHADVIAGRVPLLIDAWHSVRPHVESGRMKIIAAASEGPVPGADLPLMKTDYPGLTAQSIVGLVAPANTPPAIIARLSESARAVMFDPALAPRLAEQGLEPVAADPEAFGTLITTETERWRRVVRERGLRPI